MLRVKIPEIIAFHFSENVLPPEISQFDERFRGFPRVESVRRYTPIFPLNQDVVGLVMEYPPEVEQLAPEKRWLEDYFPFGMVNFQGLC